MTLVSGRWKGNVYYFPWKIINKQHTRSSLFDKHEYYYDLFPFVYRTFCAFIILKRKRLNQTRNSINRSLLINGKVYYWTTRKHSFFCLFVCVIISLFRVKLEFFRGYNSQLVYWRDHTHSSHIHFSPVSESRQRLNYWLRMFNQDAWKQEEEEQGSFCHSQMDRTELSAE